MRQKSLLGCAAAVLAIGWLVGVGGDAQASSSHLNLSALLGVRSVVGASWPYYCRITKSDGTQVIQVLAGDKISEKKKTLNEAYATELKEWTAARREWAKAAGRRPYPVPKPVVPAVKKLAKIPVDSDDRPKARERQTKKLNIWNVCVIKAMDGSRDAKSIRRDRMLLEKTKLLSEYAAEALAWIESRKDDPEGTKGTKAPGRPSIVVFKGGLRDADAADRLAERLSAKLNPEEKPDDGDE